MLCKRHLDLAPGVGAGNLHDTTCNAGPLLVRLATVVKGSKPVFRRCEAVAVFAAAFVILGVGVPTAHAGYTGISNTFPFSQNHAWVLNNIYQDSVAENTTFTKMADGVSYGNGDISVVRMDDFGMGDPLNIFTGSAGSANDQIWVDGVTDVSAAAKFSMSAGDNQSFGFYGEGGNEYQELFAVTGSNFNVSGESTGWNFTGQTWRWVNNSNGFEFSSLVAENPAPVDHVVTYRVYGAGLGVLSRWLLFWDNDGDGDFMDLVIEVTTALSSPPTPMPLPSPVVLGMVGLVGVVVLRRRLAPRRAWPLA